MVQLITMIVRKLINEGYQSLDAEERALMEAASKQATQELKDLGKYEAELQAREEIRQRVLAA